MRTTGTVIAIAALAAVAVAPTPSAAFGIRLGPFYLGIPFPGHRHHYAHVSPAVPPAQTAALPNETPSAPAAPTQRVTSALLDPGLALPAVYDGIFSPPAASPAWPFSYEAIFQAAFAKRQDGASACAQPINSNAVMGRIQAEVRPTSAQAPQLQKLGGALAMAGQYLASACPRDIPAQPTARMQMMEWQIEKLAQALDIVRPPLAEFEQSLSDEQRARFAAAAPAGSGNAAAGNATMPACAPAPTAIDASVEQISLAVQPTDTQRDALNNVKDAFRSAANGLDTHCQASVPADPLARLEATQARLDATWRAVVAIQSALAKFETSLSDEQRARLDATDFAAVQ
jgi:LTXXQ motif family protein